MGNARTLLVDLVDGAISGAVATWVMGQVTTYLYEHESTTARTREDEARDGKTAYGVAVEKVAHAVGMTITDEQRQAYGGRLHWALGIAAGAAYGVLRRRVPNAEVAKGLAFGGAFWLATDEGLVYALGLTPGPTEFPWQTHARGLAGHLTFGAVADRVLNVLQPA